MTHDGAGGPGSPGRHRSPWGRSGRILPIRWGRIIAVVAVLVVIVAGLVVVRGRMAGDHRAGSSGGRPGAPVAAPAPTPGDEDGPADVTAAPVTARPGAGPALSTASAASPSTGIGSVSPRVAPTAARPRTGPPPGSPAVPVAARPAGPALSLSSTRVDLGDVDSVWRLDLRGEGTAPVDVVIGASPSWLTVVPGRSRIDPGAVVPLVITLDRAAAPSGPIDVTVPVRPRKGDGGGDVRVTARVDGSPQVVSMVAAPTTLYPSGCAPAARVTASPVTASPVTVSTVTVSVVDATGIFAAELVVNLPDGGRASVSLVLDRATGNRSTWSGPVGPARVAGAITYTATVTDLDGRRSRAPGSLTVLPCPS
ncbi:hypothetical protein KBI5_04830 [Frankia sp. KB5]|nr:hypothetical protein KBI5_04830 [Frankia sp. KB5]